MGIARDIYFPMVRLCVDIAPLAKKNSYVLILSNRYYECCETLYPKVSSCRPAWQPDVGVLSLLPSIFKFNIPGISKPEPHPRAFLWLAELDRPTNRTIGENVGLRKALPSSLAAPPSIGRSSRRGVTGPSD